MSKNKALIGMGILNFLGCLDLTIVNTALPDIQQYFHVSDAHLQWTINALLLALTSTMVLVGKLGDRYGRRLMLYVGMILFAITSLGAMVSSQFGMLVVFRFFQGISIGILYTAPVALMPAVFPDRVEKAMSIMIAVSGLGLALGPVLGGFLTSLFSWKAIFLINLPLTLLAYACCRGSIPESKSDTLEKLDLPGVLLMVIALPILIYTTVNIHQIAWNQVLMAYAIFLFLAALFVLREIKASSPIIDFHLFSNRDFIRGLIANFFMAFFYCISFFFIPLHLSEIGYGVGAIGLILLPAMLMVAIFSPFTSRWVERFGAKKLILLGYGLFVISAAWQGYFMHDTNVLWLFPGYLALGLGWALVLSPALTTGVTSLPKEMGGVAIGSLGTTHNLGGTIGLALGVSLGYAHAMVLTSLTSLISLGLIGLL